MRIGDRVLLIIAMLLCIAASAYLFAIVWGFLPLQSLVQALYNIMDAWYYRVGVTALLLLMALGFVRLLFVRTNPGQVLLREGIAINQSGDVRISVDALRADVRRGGQDRPQSRIGRLYGEYLRAGAFDRHQSALQSRAVHSGNRGSAAAEDRADASGILRHYDCEGAGFN